MAVSFMYSFEGSKLKIIVNIDMFLAIVSLMHLNMNNIFIFNLDNTDITINLYITIYFLFVVDSIEEIRYCFVHIFFSAPLSFSSRARYALYNAVRRSIFVKIPSFNLQFNSRSWIPNLSKMR